MGRRLLIGSGNADKAAELRELLDGSGWEILSLKDFPAIVEPEEDADTYEDNALLKARYYGQAFGVDCVADDSGLEVDALDGGPGVYSARYAGEGCTYDDNNRKLLGALNGLPAEERTARFVCCAAFVNASGDEETLRGVVEGHIATAPRGDRGFGYDPVFVPVGDDRTFGEMTPEEKHASSHRAKAFRAMSDYLRGLAQA